MELIHESLLALGFTELFNRPTRYVYKGVTGRLNPDGSFQFHGFSPMVTRMEDMKWMRMIIDYQHQPATTIIPLSDH